MPEDVRHCHCLVTSHFATKDIKPRYVALAPSVKQHRAFFKKECSALPVAANPELATLYPEAVVAPLASEGVTTVPLCLVYANGRDNKTLPHREHYLLSMSARIRKKQQRIGSTAC